jgi:hypothetical protein
VAFYHVSGEYIPYFTQTKKYPLNILSIKLFFETKSTTKIITATKQINKHKKKPKQKKK